MTTTSSILEAKAALRTEMRGRLATIPAAERQRASDRVFQQLEEFPAWREARSVLLYAPTPNEPATDRLWAPGGTALDGKQLHYPRVNGTGLEVRHVVSPADLQIGRYGLREPSPERTEWCDPATLDLVLVPGLAFTQAGARLGRGSGYFDRFLAILPERVATIGVAFAAQMLDSLPEAAHDQRVRWVLWG